MTVLSTEATAVKDERLSFLSKRIFRAEYRCGGRACVMFYQSIVVSVFHQLGLSCGLVKCRLDSTGFDSGPMNTTHMQCSPDTAHCRERIVGWGTDQQAIRATIARVTTTFRTRMQVSRVRDWLSSRGLPMQSGAGVPRYTIQLSDGRRAGRH